MAAPSSKKNTPISIIAKSNKASPSLGGSFAIDSPYTPDKTLPRIVMMKSKIPKLPLPSDPKQIFCSARTISNMASA
eukprot:CAMPEP_0116019672 /NCGR_PEP_ID=MMETSP0321-20121206/9369_1 /TAXON_ID=163516 /ORGANISM="Leptocylindrus danicus var. danicus, Strain B650" /LENGTH=76 /DNA_ID=CAMNT_0003490273 /DNA_START=14 /DNA_END=241 /DNA_ORIENTATION=+